MIFENHHQMIVDKCVLKKTISDYQKFSLCKHFWHEHTGSWVKGVMSWLNWQEGNGNGSGIYWQHHGRSYVLDAREKEAGKTKHRLQQKTKHQLIFHQVRPKNQHKTEQDQVRKLWRLYALHTLKRTDEITERRFIGMQLQWANLSAIMTAITMYDL